MISRFKIVFSYFQLCKFFYKNNWHLPMVDKNKPEIYQSNSRTIQLYNTDCGLACIHTLSLFYNTGLQCSLPFNSEKKVINGTLTPNNSNENNFPTLEDFQFKLPERITKKRKQIQESYLQRIRHIQNFQKQLMKLKNLEWNSNDIIQPWTIDYAYYIRYCLPCQFIFCTQQIGVHPKYKDLDFYAEVINLDYSRVNRLFGDAEKENVLVKKVHIELEVLKKLVQKKDIFAIVIIDSVRLQCLRCDYVPSETDEDEESLGEEDSSTTTSWEDVPTESDSETFEEGSFEGHFILVVDADDSQIFYKDSSLSSCNTCVCNANRFDKARLTFGTDEDIIIISMNPNIDISQLLQKEMLDYEELKKLEQSNESNQQLNDEMKDVDT